jgi:lysophospholipase L1-like esterase
MKVIDPSISQKRKRMLVFKIISIGLPFLLLIGLEFVLRAFHVGHNPELFITFPQDKNYFYLNPDASKRYFVDQKNATTGNIEPFRKTKETGTLRIFVLGESTTIGYPYFHNGSFHRWLQYRLSHTFPDRHFEVINLALTAVNSYTIAGFAKEVVDYQPDAVLIYTGHNEYYGTLGVGSTESFGSNPFLIRLILRLRGFRIVQLMTGFYQKLASIWQNQEQKQEGTRMQRMVAEQEIPYQSEIYQRGVAQFRSNMEQTLQTLQEHHIPVFLSNLVSNEKDLRPFSNAEARRNFELGRKEYDRGNYKAAKIHFAKARDMDGLRFRAPGELNTIIAQLGSRYSNVHLVDAKAIFEANSSNHIIGDELILEHVHPNLRGYALLSEVFYQKLKLTGILPRAPQTEMTFDQLSEQMPVPTIDSLAGAYKVVKLKNSWPFKGNLKTSSVKTDSYEEKMAYDLANRRISWDDAMDEAYTHYINQKQFPEARKIVESLILEHPGDADLYKKSAMLSGEIKDENSAAFSFRKAFDLSPSFDTARYLFVLYLKSDQPEKALPYLNYAIKNNSSEMNLAPIGKQIGEILVLKESLAADSSNIGIKDKIALAYQKMGNRDAAMRYNKSIALANSAL